jgi:predicted GNAT family N-acyltransferase
MQAKSPHSAAEWASYHDLRWRVLRAPWGQPRGGNAGEGEEDDVHAMIADEAGEAIAVGRIIFKSAAEAQIRSMATAEGHRGAGLGQQIMEYLEQAARQRGVSTIVLNSRNTATEFYSRLGYEAVGEGPTLFGVVKHTVMRKRLKSVDDAVDAAD